MVMEMGFRIPMGIPWKSYWNGNNSFGMEWEGYRKDHRLKWE